jgi:hypothetical protein
MRLNSEIGNGIVNGADNDNNNDYGGRISR